MGFWDEAEVISAYSRAQALEDGELIDVTEAASEVGFKLPVAITRQVHATLEDSPNAWESYRGRLHDVVWMAANAARANRDNERARVQLIITTKAAPRAGARALHELQSVIGPGDTPAAVITIGYPDDF